MSHLPLGERVPDTPAGPDEILDRFLAWVADLGLEPYPAQEEAFLELMAGRHVILGTPTGSGKSLVAVLAHFRGLCERERSFYTAPTKALVSEKFFWLCEELGARGVGMLTGDASINPDAPVICCTTEVLANMALRRGDQTPARYVVLDEFHYYGDRDRGAAWQIPLLALPHSRFLLMSATLGEPGEIARRLEERTGVGVACVYSEQRPVPLDFDYRETPLHETVEALLEERKAPVYIVHFTQRECGEQAQALTSARIASRQERRALARACKDFRFDSSYGKDMRRFLLSGIAVHHAGLLPRYRLLVEQLAQRGLLKVICGTDTLGVGVNIPIRTVLFSSLAKFDGERVGLLKAREFKQIAGRAGRKGFDEQGSVVCQAPRHVIERKRASARGRRKRPQRAGPRNPIQWNQDTFEALVTRPPEPLDPRFAVTHGLLVQVLQRDPDGDAQVGYRAVAELIDRCHAGPARKRRLRREAARVFRSMRRAGVVDVTRDPDTRRFRVSVSEDLQEDFSLHHSLSLYLVDAVQALDPQEPDYGLDVLSLCEAILENPNAILYAQENTLKRELLAQLKAWRVPYEERQQKLDELSYPRPLAEFVYQTFELFAEQHPWLAAENIRPKGIARELYESFGDFHAFVRRYGLARMEGLLLRYLGQTYQTLLQNVPDFAKSDAVYEILAFLRLLLEEIDSSLLDEWERLLAPGRAAGRDESPAERDTSERLRPDLLRDERMRSARIRAELHRLVHLLSTRSYPEAAAAVAPHGDWQARDFERALAPYWDRYDALRFDHEARLSEHTAIQALGPARWRVAQTLLDPDDDGSWVIEAEVDLGDDPHPRGSLLRLLRIGP